MRQTEYKDFIMELRIQLLEDSKSIVDLNSPTTIKTDMISE